MRVELLTYKNIDTIELFIKLITCIASRLVVFFDFHYFHNLNAFTNLADNTTVIRFFNAVWAFYCNFRSFSSHR